MTSALPSTSWAEFPARRLREPRLVWRNDELPDPLDPLALAFCIPHAEDGDAHFDEDRLLFAADRYGGRGVGPNGGSARCGHARGWQVKGIGPTPLVGRFADPGKAHGELTLAEAVREALWGEICATALPHGAVRAAAILLTGTQTYSEGSFPRKTSRRALLVRPFAMRPAHFMRAVNFFPRIDDPLCHVIDAERTRTACARLLQALETSYPRLVLPASRKHAATEHYLAELARTLADQIAAARMKRIPHGSLNCSNVCLDGRLLDFGSITAVSDFGPLVTSRGKPPFGFEEEALAPTLANLRFQASRHSAGADSAAVPMADLYTAALQPRLKTRLAVELLKLTGIPEAHLAAIGPKALADLQGGLEGLLAFRRLAPLTLQDMPDRLAPAPLNRVMRALALSRAAVDADAALMPWLPSPRARRALVEAFMNARAAYLALLPQAARRSALLFQSVNALRVNAPLDFLYRATLAAELSRLTRDDAAPQAIRGFIGDKAGAARALLAEPEGGRIRLGPFATNDLVFGLTGVHGAAAMPLTQGQAIEQLAPAFLSGGERHRLSRLAQAEAV